MKALIYDTRVKTKNNEYLHFDVYVNEQQVKNINAYVLEFLSTIGVEAEKIQQARCSYCHSEIAYPNVEKAINTRGYYLVPLEVLPIELYDKVNKKLSKLVS